MRLLRSAKTAQKLYALSGPRGIAKAVVARFWPEEPLNISRHFSFVTRGPFGPSLDEPPPPKTINWVIPPFGIGSGGHINIFRLVLNLEKLGFQSIIHIMGECEYTSAALAREAIRAHFFPIEARVELGVESMRPCTVCVATSWQTAYVVRDFRAAAKKVYFVQDFEPNFYAHGSEYTLAEETYRFGFTGITAGGWLQEKLAREYGMVTHAMGFSYDRDLYKPAARQQHAKRVFFYARPPTPRRAFELGIIALSQFARAAPNVEIVLAGWDLAGLSLNFPHRAVGNVPLDQLGALYSECDAGLVLSMTNLSLLPLELMACGCVVVSNRGPNVEWLLDEHISVLSEATPEALSAALFEIIANDQRRAELAKAGVAFAASTDWSIEANRVGDVFQSLAELAG